MRKYVIWTIPTDNDDFQIDILNDGTIRVSYFEDGHYKDQVSFTIPKRQDEKETV